MGYSSGTTMEDRGLRDIERWRDKIEVRLDNRQVFFLFFGSALVACMLFVLGVIVGKRLESRGRAVSPEIEDPLALLDKVATSPRPAQAAVTFPQALFGAKNGEKGADKHPSKKAALLAPPVEEPAPAPASANAAQANEAKPAPVAPKAESKPAPVIAKVESKPAPVIAKVETKPAPVLAKAETKPALAKAETKPALAKAETKPAPVATAPAEKPAEPAPAKSKPTAEPTKTASIPTIAAAADGKSKGRFALQLSSFQDKSEAQAFAQKFEGERPYLIVSEIPGKGTWYRVRVGDYASAKDALNAKLAFEKRHNVIAYVAQK